MKKFPGHQVILWAKVEWEIRNVKNLSFFGELPDEKKVLLESMASLMIGRPCSKLSELTIRECEAFLRDKNSVISIEGLSESDENELKTILQWLLTLTPGTPSEQYRFPSEKGPFSGLKLSEKIRELKAFLNSPEVLLLYQNDPCPELVDVEELTVYIHAPYETQRERALFEELHSLGVKMYQEVHLNFIPES